MGLVVTGASGALGRLVVAALLERVAAAELILVTRSPESLGDVARLGATVRYGDFERVASLPAAFAGGRRMLVISTIGAADTAAAHRGAFEAAAEAGVEHIVWTSVSNPRRGSSLGAETRFTQGPGEMEEGCSCKADSVRPQRVRLPAK